MNDSSFQITTDISILGGILALILVIVIYRLFILNRQMGESKKELERLSNEFRAMNSGQLGMGREIRKVIQGMASVESLQQEQQEMTSSNGKAYEQAGVLLSRGATIEEVVETCGIAPAEAELLAIVRNQVPSSTK